MLTRRSLLLVTAGLALSGMLPVGQAKAWHYGAPHERYHDSNEEIVIERRHRGRGFYEVDRHHRPRHHQHCREVEFHDHHGNHRIRTICD